MADAKITELGANTTPAITDIIPMVDDPGGSPVTQKIALANLFGALIAPQGFLINGKIVPSVASSNLTVAIKGLDGNDPSATNPVYCRIGDTVRSITSALSVTKNAGTNWFNSGGTGLATNEIDYFVYLGYNATNGVVIGFSRIIGNSYDDFDTTTTDEKYCAISTITNASATDYYEVIGRFGATLSAGAGYTWTVPTFTAKNLIQKPIYETRLLTFTNTLAGNGSMTVASTENASCKYKVVRGFVRVNRLQAYGNFDGSANAQCKTQIPFDSNGGAVFPALCANFSYTVYPHGMIGLADASNVVTCQKHDYSTFSLNGTAGLYWASFDYTY